MLFADQIGVRVKKVLEPLPEAEIQHMRRVGVLVEFFLQVLYQGGALKWFSLEECELYGKAAAFHDIGKVKIPLSILTKPEKLEKEEAAILYQHPVFARELFMDGLFSGIPERFVRLAMEAAAYHHERWDGTGYPYGLKEESIPFIARITSICDAYDAMTSDRVYRKAHPHRFACRVLEENAGAQFDPVLTWAFLDHEFDLSLAAARGHNP
jgi:HD-GYP domain-containing protein (c-di-GMP phosphodiesterase class II)